MNTQICFSSHFATVNLLYGFTHQVYYFFCYISLVVYQVYIFCQHLIKVHKILQISTKILALICFSLHTFFSLREKQALYYDHARFAIVFIICSPISSAVTTKSK